MSRYWIALFMTVLILGGGGIGSSILCAHAAGRVHAESGFGACATDCESAPAACEPGCSELEVVPAGCYDCVDLVVSHTAAPSRGPGALPLLHPVIEPLPALAGPPLRAVTGPGDRLDFPPAPLAACTRLQI